MLRVTSGSLRGFKLYVPGTGKVRPPLEMTRQAIFNILGQNLDGQRVADVFAGSGIMGIEALSRGAEAVLFVEKNRAAASCILTNLGKTRMAERAEVVPADAFFPKRYLTGKSRFDVVFIDPPFSVVRDPQPRAELANLVEEFFLLGALCDDAQVVLRVPSETPFEFESPNLIMCDERTYGHSRVLFICPRAAGGQ